jgi:hypothetical protein
MNGVPGGRTIQQPQTVVIDETANLNCEIVFKDCCSACVRAEIEPGVSVIYRCVRPAGHVVEEREARIGVLHCGMAWDRETNKLLSSHESLSWIMRDGKPVVMISA